KHDPRLTVPLAYSENSRFDTFAPVTEASNDSGGQMSQKRLEGQVAVVTGASRGIGRACAEELAREGAAVVVNYHQSQEPAEALVGDVVSNGGRSIAFGANVADADECKALIDKTIETYGQI